MKNKEKYTNYINEHIDNVKDVYAKVIDLVSHIAINKDRLDSLIDVHDKSKFSKEEFNQYLQWFFPDNEMKDYSVFMSG